MRYRSNICLKQLIFDKESLWKQTGLIKLWLIERYTKAALLQVKKRMEQLFQKKEGAVNEWAVKNKSYNLKRFHLFLRKGCYTETGDTMKRILKWLLVVVLLVGVGGGGWLVYQGHSAYRELVQKKTVEQAVEEVRSRPDYVTLEQISAYLLDATISVEDKHFYEHNGVDLAGVSRAVLSNLFHIGSPSGGSTISQQLSKNLYDLFYDTTLSRKVAEVFLTYDLESCCSKNEILELYLNVVNYGDGYTGVKQASYGYFGKAPAELTLDEASLLAGIPQSPANFQLSDHKAQALKKQKVVLEAMVKEEKISEEQMRIILGKEG